ncbi:MAG: hypothetical protein QM586_17890, partial [Xenophilus sp.]
MPRPIAPVPTTPSRENFKIIFKKYSIKERIEQRCQNMFAFLFFVKVLIVRFRHAAATLFVLGFVVPAWALTLGRVQGTAWIGKPLDVAIPLNLDTAEASGSLCPGVEVVQGNVAMDPLRVTASLESGSRPETSLLRIRTTGPVEEPIVTLTVRAGCAATSTRSYALLADLPPVEAEPSAVAAPIASARPAGRQPPVVAPLRPATRASRGLRAEERGGAR